MKPSISAPFRVVCDAGGNSSGEKFDYGRLKHLRMPNGYLDRILRPATDNIGRALAYEQLPDAVKKKLEKSRSKTGRMARDARRNEPGSTR